MGVVHRIWDQNLLKVAGVIFSADCSLISLPLRFLLDQSSDKVWRSAEPHVVTAGFNDKLDIRRDGGGSGVFVVTLIAGSYATPADYSAMVLARIVVADGTGGWTGSYNGSTRKHTFTSSAGVVTFLTNTGANLATSAWRDLGFSTAANNTGTGSLGFEFVSDNAVSQGRHFVACDLLTAQAMTAAAALGHNLSATGSISLKTSDTSIVHALTAGNTDALTGDSDKVYKYISRTNRYAVFLIDDPGNTDAFSQLAIVYAGTYRQPTVGYSNRYVEVGEDLSEIMLATEGANYGDLRPEQRAWQLEWDNIATATGDAALFRAFRTATPKGKNFFFEFDQSLATPSTLVYGYRASPLPLPVTSGDYWTPSMTFVESIG